MKKIAMSSVGVSSSERRLLRRRHTDTTEAFNDDDRIHLSKNIIRKRSSIRRSLSRKFSTLSSSKKIIESEDVLPDVATATSEVASVSLTSVEESISTTTPESLLVSSTHVDIQEHGHWDNKGRHPDRIDEDDGDEEEESDDRCDDFLSKLLELMPCSPQQHNESADKPQNNKQMETQETEDDYDERMMTKIECILKDTLAEGESSVANEEYVPPPTSSSSPLNENENTLAQPPPTDEWIQDPLLLVATPGSNMIVHRIRRVSEPSYFVSHDSEAKDSQCIGQADTLDNNNNKNKQLIQLPINNGKERDSFVIDFETDIFAGTALFRIRNSNAWKSQNSRAEEEDNNKNDNSFDYFGRHNRKFQMVIRGRFKSNETVMADCMSGLLLDHPLSTSSSPNMDCSDLFGQETSKVAPPEDNNTTIDSKRSKRVRRLKRGKKSSINEGSTLPPKWALRAAVKVAGVFSPRVDADLECAHPRILTPLCSTAQTITVSRRDSGDIPSARLDEVHAEPYYESDASLVYDLCSSSPSSKPISSASNDVQRRKRYCDATYDARIESMANFTTTTSQSSNTSSPCFDPDAEYTFEFLQHLIDYNDLSLDLGRVIGKVHMGGAFKGQPVRFISAAVKQQRGDNTELTLNDLDCIWSFDLYHKTLLR